MSMKGKKIEAITHFICLYSKQCSITVPVTGLWNVEASAWTELGIGARREDEKHNYTFVLPIYK